MAMMALSFKREPPGGQIKPDELIIIKPRPLGMILSEDIHDPSAHDALGVSLKAHLNGQPLHAPR